MRRIDKEVSTKTASNNAIWLLLLAILLCTGMIFLNRRPQLSNPTPQIQPSEKSAPIISTFVPTFTHAPTKTSVPITPSTTPSQPSPSMLECKDTANMIGQFVSCKIEKAVCNFEPDVNGDPTFCNDAPYPNHKFTLLVWGQDWTDYDGKCIVINGVVGSYNGKPQIITKNRARVSFCP